MLCKVFFSKSAATPIPLLIHMITTPYLSFFLNKFGKSFATRAAPVQPRGCPSAIAPPHGLTFTFGIFRASTKYAAWLQRLRLFQKSQMFSILKLNFYHEKKRLKRQTPFLINFNFKKAGALSLLVQYPLLQSCIPLHKTP